MTLFDVSVAFQGGEKSEDIVFMESEPPRKLTDSQLLLPTEGLQHMEGIAYGLNRVIALRFGCHE